MIHKICKHCGKEHISHWTPKAQNEAHQALMQPVTPLAHFEDPNAPRFCTDDPLGPQFEELV